MRKPSRGNASRIAAAMLIAGLLAPAVGWAQDEEPELEIAPPQSHWYDRPVRLFDETFDLIVVRPLSALTLATGAVLFVPAAILTAPNGMESVRDAYDRFIQEPGEYFWGRPLGQF